MKTVELDFEGHASWHLLSGIKVVIENKWDWLVFCDIFVNKEYPLFIGQPIPRPVKVLDLGANVGYFSLYAADECRKRKQPFEIIAIEGMPDTFSNLVKRVKEVSEIKCGLGLVGKKEGSDFISLSANHGTSSIVSNTSKLPKMSVEYVNLDKLIPESWSVIDVIKCDIECSELEFVQNYSNILKKTGLVYMEIHHKKVNAAKLRKLMVEYGFKYNTLLIDRKTNTIEVFSK